MAMTLQQIVERRLKELGLGPVEAATANGLERTFIRDIVEGRKKRVLDYDKLGKALGLDTSAMSKGIYKLTTDAAAPVPSLRTVRVAAHVQAGYWAEQWEWADDEQYDVAVPADPQLRGFRLYAAEARGRSMDRKYPEGTVVVFTNVMETEESPQPGKRYVVERARSDGQKEHTVKLLHRDESVKFWLVPESTDPLFQAPISVEQGTQDGDEVRIVGRVHYAVSRE